MAKKPIVKEKEKVQPKKAVASESRKEITEASFAFGKENYMIILAGIVVLVIGYLLMIGGGADKPENFNPEIFSARRITIAPVTLLAGFAIVLYGIMKKPKEQE
ncbi:MAG: DUF3098 domain-containing protein [Bacteroidetes bacterium]|nr:DUF3098 domain-containing protein [Bacteroidota bacterium]